MSTLPSPARVSSDWKEEVNQRIAAHKNRKPAIVLEQDAPGPHASSTRASAAAARVAARFAKAPSYSDLLENEARAAVRAAEAVSRAALQAQAAAESVLAELQAANDAEPGWQFTDDQEEMQPQFAAAPIVAVEDLDTQPSGRVPAERDEWDRPTSENPSYQVRWEPDSSMTHTDAHAASPRVQAADWHSPTQFEQEGAVDIVEGDQPIHANLIQFPREIVATRKVRPRRAEGPFAEQSEVGSQLSIFEVDPEAVSIDPAAADAMNPTAAPNWMCPEWYGMELDNPEDQLRAEAEEKLNEREVPVMIVDRRIEQAPLTMRLMALVIDGSLVMAAFLAFTMEIVRHIHVLPGMRTAEITAAIGVAFTGALYLALFYYLGCATPGMRYARIALSTFEGGMPTRQERLQRCATLLLSVLPVGVGLLWSVFDEEHLSWHDRLSRTYLRAY